MQKELEMWESENNKHAEALMMEQRSVGSLSVCHSKLARKLVLKLV